MPDVDIELARAREDLWELSERIALRGANRLTRARLRAIEERITAYERMIRARNLEHTKGHDDD